MRQGKVYPYLLIAPALLFITAVSLYPTLFSVYLSLNRVAARPAGVCRHTQF